MRVRNKIKRKMYSLVEFVDDKIIYITPSKGITLIENNLVWAPYKRMGYYEAKVLATDTNKSKLIKLMKERQIRNTNVTANVKRNLNESNLAFFECGISNLPETIKQSTEYMKQSDGCYLLPVGAEEVRNTNVPPNVDRNLNESNSLHFENGSSDLPETTNESTEYMKQSGGCDLLPVGGEEVRNTNVQRNLNENNSVHFESGISILPESINELSANMNQRGDCDFLPVSGEAVRKMIFSHSGNLKENIPVHYENGISISVEATRESEDCVNQNSGGNLSPVGNEEEQEQKEAKKSHKKHCCFFCGKLVYQIVRHWSNIHREEKDVKNITFLHFSNPLRRKRIDRLRGRGDFEYNKTKAPDSDQCIVSRISEKSDTIFFPCPTCLRYISKKNLRRHTKFCSPNRGSRNLQGAARKLTSYIHEKASETLRTVITPDMFQDEVINQVLFDEILIIYGNFMCIKYNGESHLKNHIRAQLRLLGRFMLRVKAHDNNIKCCKDLIHSKNIDTIHKAVDDIAGFDHSSNMYKHPTNSRTLLTELKKLISVVKSESDKTEDDFLMKRAKGLSRRVKQELAPHINRISKNSENSIRRFRQHKRDCLPEMEDVGKYLHSLLGNISLLLKKLQKQFSVENWTQLAKHLMVYLAAFNRKRPGETQRIEINDFENRQELSKKDVISLNDKDKLQADKYVRVGFRGKLGNSTALLIHKTKILPGILLLLQYRKKAGVHSSNKFLFAKPSHHDKYATFDAYRSHTQFSENMGFNPENFTFTKLRKHFATEVAKKVESQEEEKRVSNYMSHNFDIHKKIYDQSTTLIDITQVSKHLEGTSAVSNINQDHKNFSKSLVQHETMKHSSAKKKYIQEINILKNDKYRTPSHSSDTFGENEIFEYNLRKKNVIRKSRHSSLNSSSSSEKEQSSLEKKFSRLTNFSMDGSSCSDHGQPSLEEVEQCLGKYKKRRLWSSMEKKITRRFFAKEIRENKIIKNEKVLRFTEKYKNVMKRSRSMIKQWIECEKWKLEQKAEGFNEKRPRFSTPEKEILEKSLEHHSLEGSEPSLQELESLSEEYNILKHRSTHSLLKKFRDLNRRRLAYSSESL